MGVQCPLIAQGGVMKQVKMPPTNIPKLTTLVTPIFWIALLG